MRGRSPDRIVERKADIFPVLLLESMVAEIPAERLAQVAEFDPGVLENRKHPSYVQKRGGEDLL